jgi:hypothetical protein
MDFNKFWKRKIVDKDFDNLDETIKEIEKL